MAFSHLARACLLSLSQDALLTQKELSEKLKRSKFAVHRAIFSLVSEGLLEEIPLWKIKNYRLTEAGKKSVAVSLIPYERGYEEPQLIKNVRVDKNVRVTPDRIVGGDSVPEGGGGISSGIMQDRVNGYRLKFRITRPPADRHWLEDGRVWRSSSMRNWTKYRRFEDDITFVVSPSSVMAYVLPFYAVDAEVGGAKVFEVAGRWKVQLEREYPGLVLGSPERIAVVVAEEHAKQHDAFADLVCASKLTLRSDVLQVDHSVGPEVDFYRKGFSKEDWMKYVRFVTNYCKRDTELDLNKWDKLDNLDELTSFLRSGVNLFNMMWAYQKRIEAAAVPVRRRKSPDLGQQILTGWLHGR